MSNKVEIKSLDDGTPSAGDGFIILKKFVDIETDYLVVEEVCGKRPNRVLKTSTIDRNTNRIIVPEDRKSDVPSTTVAKVGEYELLVKRSQDMETGSETIREELRCVGGDDILISRERSAFFDQDAESLVEIYRERCAEEQRRQEYIDAFKYRPRAEQIAYLIGDLRKARRANGEFGLDENLVFDPEHFAKYRKMAPEIDTMIDEIFRGVFIGCWPKDEIDARRRVNKGSSDAG